MRIIKASLETPPELPRVELPVERMILAKRRWRGVAADGEEFGFDLPAPLKHGTAFFATEGAVYVIAQHPEPVLEILLIPRPAPVARLGWAIGNLHHAIQVSDEWIRVPDERGLRALLMRERIPFTEKMCVFEPFAAAHGHGV